MRDALLLTDQQHLSTDVTCANAVDCYQSLLPTSCSGSWTLQRELWAARRSTTTAWHTCFTLSCIGSMWQIESHTSLRWRVYKCLHGQAPDSVWAVYTGRSSCWSTPSSFHQPPSTRCSTVSARYVQPSHLRCRWTNDMELVPKQFAWAGHANWLFSSYSEDVSFWSVLGTLSALEALFATMRYINWHLHLHYWRPRIWAGALRDVLSISQLLLLVIGPTHG